MTGVDRVLRRLPSIGFLLIFTASAGCGDFVSEPEPLGVEGGHSWVLVAAGDEHTCGVTSDRRAWCWGEDDHGQLGGSGGDSGREPVEVGGGHAWSMVTVGDEHSCGVTTEGDAYCWGDGEYGQLGDGGRRSARSPVEVAGGHTWVSVSAGDDITCGVTTGRDAYCWGGGDDDDDDDDDYRWEGSSTPDRVRGGHAWSSLSAGDEHACGVTTDGDAYCWGGYDDDDDDDDDDRGRRSRSPVRVRGGQSWSMVTVGEKHVCGVSADAGAYCWRGYDDDDDDDDHDEDDDRRWPADPRPVGDGHTWQVLSAGDEHVCGVTTDGAAWCWGEGDYGQLGDGRRRSSDRPVRVAGDHQWTMVSAGDEHTCGVTMDHDVYCWGEGDHGQLGTVSSSRARRPVRSHSS